MFNQESYRRRVGQERWQHSYTTGIELTLAMSPKHICGNRDTGITPKTSEVTNKPVLGARPWHPDRDRHHIASQTKGRGLTELQH